MSFSPAEANKALQFCFPELKSSYAAYPMHRSSWLDPKDSVDGMPGFVESPNVGPKEHYTYGTSRYGQGYYHLASIDAHKILTQRAYNEGVSACCCFGGQDADYWDTTRRILHARARSTIPNDDNAQAQGVQAAQSQAKNHYQFQQNAQVAIGAVQAGVNLAA